MMTKLNRLVKTNADEWNLDKKINDSHGIEVARIYSCPKKLISQRLKTVHIELSEEEKRARAERLRAFWLSKRAKN